MLKSPVFKYGLLLLVLVLTTTIVLIPSKSLVQSQGAFTPTPTTLPPPQIVESDSEHVYREGQWTSQITSSASGGSYLYSDDTNNILKLGFEGTSVTITYVESPSFGSFAIEIDHTLVRTVIATNADTHFGVQTTINYLGSGLHFLHVYPAQGMVGIDTFEASKPFAPVLVPPPNANEGSVPLSEEEGGAAGVGSYTYHLEVDTPQELIQAITSANTNGKHHVIHLAPGTYNFTSGMSSTVTQAALQITGTVTIIGSGGIDPETGRSLYPSEMQPENWSILEQSGANALSVLDITATGNVKLYNILIHNGGGLERFAGGGIRNNGRLTIYNSRIQDNLSGVYGGGLWNNGIATVINTEFLNNSSIDTNPDISLRAGSGGSAIANEDTATLDAYCSTFQNNLVNPTTGLVPGGAIYNQAPNSQIRARYNNFVNNRAEGENPECTELPIACPVHIRDFYSVSPIYIAENYWSNQSIQNVTTSSTIYTNYGDYSGDSLPCYVPPPPQASTIIVNTVAYEFNEDGDCSFTEAIAAANRNISIDECASGSLGDADTIVLAPEDGDTFDIPDTDSFSAASGGGGRMLYPATPNPTGSPMQISNQACDSAHRTSSIFCVLSSGTAVQDAVTIEGEHFNLNLLTAFAQRGKRLFYVAANTKLTLRNVTIVGFHVEGNGGAVLNEGTVEIEGSTIFRNRATGDGGAIYNAATAKLTVQDSRIYQNTALARGGAIYNAGSGGVISNTCIFNNAAPMGGGVYLDSSNLDLNNNYWDIPGLYDPNSPNKPLDDPNTIYGGAISQSQSGPCPTGSNLPGVTEAEACYVRPLLYSLHNQLYGVDGRTQVAKDMRSIIDPNSPQSGGLLAHYGPTINSPMNRGDNLAENPVSNGYERFTWNYGHLPVLYRVQYPSEGEPEQIWYYVKFEGSYSKHPELEGAWIAVRMNDATLGDKFYIEGVGLSEDSDPCRGYVPTVNSPSYNPSFEVTFYYDRETAANYAIANSYQNDVVPSAGTSDNFHVSSRLDFNSVPRIEAYFGSRPNIPFADFDYGRSITVETGKTGSGVFMSESIWAGGMPMTLDDESCDARTYPNLYGWRYCPDGRVSTQVWAFHTALISYFSDTSPIWPYSVDNDILGQDIIPNGDGFLGSVEYGDFTGVLTLSAGGRYGDFETKGIAEIIPQVHPELVSVRQGDYMWIDSYVNAKDENGNLIPGEFDGEYHGLLVAGWGPVEECQKVMDMDGGYLLNSDQLYPTYNEVPLNQTSGEKEYVVPYVVDFTGTRESGRTQSPILRPFYCTWYFQAEYYSVNGLEVPNLYEGGTFARGDYISLEDVKYTRHNWYFYQIPETVKVDIKQLYVYPIWSW